jgi:hypothetical protein
MLEDGLKTTVEKPTVGDYMVRNPICAELWQPISFVRQQMLANSFSFLPVKRGTDWYLVSDLDIVSHLGTGVERREKLTDSLSVIQDKLALATHCEVGEPLENALQKLSGSQSPLLVQARGGEPHFVIGIITPFDLL